MEADRAAGGFDGDHDAVHLGDSIFKVQSFSKTAYYAADNSWRFLRKS